MSSIIGFRLNNKEYVAYSAYDECLEGFKQFARESTKTLFQIKACIQNIRVVSNNVTPMVSSVIEDWQSYMGQLFDHCDCYFMLEYECCDVDTLIVADHSCIWDLNQNLLESYCDGREYLISKVNPTRCLRPKG